MPLDIIADNSVNMSQNEVDARLTANTEFQPASANQATAQANEMPLNPTFFAETTNTGLIDSLQNAKAQEERALIAENVPELTEKKYILIKDRAVAIGHYRQAELN